MKMYVWVDPYPVKWGCSVLRVIAESEDDARSLAANQAKWCQFGRLDDKQGDASSIINGLGYPDRVVDLPYAEFDHYEE